MLYFNYSFASVNIYLPILLQLPSNSLMLNIGMLGLDFRVAVDLVAYCD